MILEDKHISYLELVSRGHVVLWWNPPKTMSKYVCSEWYEGRVDVDQIVAAQMHALGATRIVAKSGKQFVALTDRGETILLDEAEAWS